MNYNENSDGVVVVGLVGSLRPGSYTRLSVQLALEGAVELGAAIRLIDLRDYALPFCDGSKDESHYPPDVAQLRQDVRSATGLVIGTPEYHGGYSGVLKNALDLMGFSEFEGKTIGLLGVSGGRMGAAHALAGLRTASRSLRAWVLPSEVSIPQVSQQFDPNGLLKDADLAQRIKDLGRQVARFAFLHSSQQAMAFLRAWEEAPVNPGGEWSN
jgi:FMN reductase